MQQRGGQCCVAARGPLVGGGGGSGGSPVGGAGGSDSSVSLALQTEATITKWLYKHHDAALLAAHNAGLLSPLWLWTHACYVDVDRVEKCVSKAVHLVMWLHRNRVDVRRVAVVCGQIDVLQRVEQELDRLMPQPAAASPLLRRHGAAASAPATEPRHAVALLLPQHIAAAALRRKGALGASKTTDMGPHGQAATSPAEEEASQDDAMGAQAHYQHVLYLMPQVPTDAHLAQVAAGRSGALLASNLAAATTSFVVIADTAWTAPCVRSRWKPWDMFLEKLAQQSIHHEHVVILGCDDRATLTAPNAATTTTTTATTTTAIEPAAPVMFAGSGLIGPKLPLCCGVHHEQSLAYSGLQGEAVLGLHGGPTFCKRLCLKPHHCHIPEHVCDHPCHPNADHRACPFACTVSLPCGHPCKMRCGAPCNCLEIVTEPLQCSHQVVIGIDPETQQPLYASVPHEYHGFCSAKHSQPPPPCVVAVSTVCATCLGPFVAPCHVLTAAGHTMAERSMSCPGCLQIGAEVRSTALAEVLVHNEQRKREMKTELARSVHEQRKGAASGVFKVGARVVVRDPSKAMPPINAEADFPGMPFVDHDAPNFFARLHGAMGIIVAQLVDVDDPTELRSVVRLSNGNFVLMGDGGMEFIRADISGITGGPSTASLLLLTGPAPASSATAEDGNPSTEEAEAREQYTQQRASMQGKQFLLMNAVRVPNPVSSSGPVGAPSNLSCAATSEESDDDGDDDMELSEVIVTVVGDDPDHRMQYALVECELFDRSVEQRALETLLTAGGDGVAVAPTASTTEDATAPRSLKRGRYEATTDAPTDAVPIDSGAAPTDAVQAMRVGKRTVRFSARLQDLDPLPFTPTGEVTVTHPQYQLVNAEFASVLKHAIQAKMGDTAFAALRVDDRLRLWPNSVGVGETFHVASIVNAPLFNADDAMNGFAQSCRGPFCLLRGACDTAASAASHAFASYRAPTARHRRGGGPGRPQPPPPRSTVGDAAKRDKLVLVPLMYVCADEVTDAMNRMDHEAQATWTKMVDERIAQQLDAKALRNDEIAYHAQLRMPPVTDAVREMERAPAVSTPVAIPSKDELTQLRLQANKLATGSAAGRRLLESKDAGQKKLALLRAKQFAQWFRQQTTEDREAVRQYVATFQQKAASKSLTSGTGSTTGAALRKP